VVDVGRGQQWALFNTPTNLFSIKTRIFLNQVTDNRFMKKERYRQADRDTEVDVETRRHCSMS
jgi:hypothetical protein